MKVRQMKITKKMSVTELLEEMGKSGALGAGRIYRATQLMAEVMENEDTTIFLSLAGPMVPGGLRKIIRDLINDGYVQALITSGANLTHDLLEAFGGVHYRGVRHDDEKLCEMGMGRIGDIYTNSEDFEVFEKKIIPIISSISKNHHHLTIQEFIKQIGLALDDDESIIRTAALKDVPIYAPGIVDSMLGLQLWMFTQENQLHLDAVGDMHQLSDQVFKANKLATIILGGGLPKHYALASNLIKGGVDAAIQVTMDRSETGSMGGAPLEEAKSWAKARAGSSLVTVIGDATILFPLMVAGARAIISRE